MGIVRFLPDAAEDEEPGKVRVSLKTQRKASLRVGTIK